VRSLGFRHSAIKLFGPYGLWKKTSELTDGGRRATVGVHKWAVDEAFVVVAERGVIGALLLAAKQEDGPGSEERGLMKVPSVTCSSRRRSRYRQPS
jgi:hypothetical protein